MGMGTWSGRGSGTGSGSNLAHRVVVRLVLVELLLYQMRELAVPLVSTAHTCGNYSRRMTSSMNSSWQCAREFSHSAQVYALRINFTMLMR